MIGDFGAQFFGIADDPRVLSPLNTTHNSTSATTTPTLYHNAAEEDPVQEEGR
eukprot:COSAG02_NODE_354_length_24016_cov_208.299231_1_plen_52_part_10